MIHRSAAVAALRGLAMGDAFGGTWFRRRFAVDNLRPGPWRWTDDTAMALVLLSVLEEHGTVDQDALALGFARAYEADPYRHYGAGMHDVLPALGRGEPWAEVTRRQFDGRGSWGNGAAMRVAPLGAYFADNQDQVQTEAVRSARVTHAHPEAAAGAAAVALATALNMHGRLDLVAIADRLDDSDASRDPRPAAETVPDSDPRSDVARALRRVAEIAPDSDPRKVAAVVGCGRRMSAPDTVPFALWCAARHPADLEAALWATASAGGDVDTTCAIVGGVVGARTGLDRLPAEWLAAAEPAI
ncbi:ADP-ribosylglycohydrolase family protein [Actinoplanes sp. NPDC049596]|uniref:ADP-ribosylglycohydrolase family protein n=1 Tax=unclassified Actinoplanes TaxID=2626549 RepID=UPI00342C2EE7